MSSHAVPSAAAITSGPLKFNYPITPLISLETVVTGEERQIATVSIVYGSMTLWSGTMTPEQSTITIPFDIVAGDVTIEKGGTFTMVPPTSSQPGSVTADLTIKTPTSSVPFRAVIAHYPLNSSV